MKFHFQAVDGRGNVARGVLRADSEDDAREALFAGELFPKKLEPADDEEKVTWVSRALVREAHRAAAGSAPAGAEATLTGDGPRAATTLFTHGESIPGTLGIRPDGAAAFVATGNAALSRVIAPSDVELAELSGFPARQLRIFLLNGDLLEFPAGWFFSGPAFKAVVRALKPKAARTKS